MPYILNSTVSKTIDFSAIKVTDFHVDADNLIIHIRFLYGKEDALGQFIQTVKDPEILTITGQDVQTIRLPYSLFREFNRREISEDSLREIGSLPKDVKGIAKHFSDSIKERFQT